MAADKKANEENLSVADRVLVMFVNALAEENDLTEVAGRLSEVLLGQKPITEAALRQALFGETDA
jgi:hypothetical protein